MLQSVPIPRGAFLFGNLMRAPRLILGNAAGGAAATGKYVPPAGCKLVIFQVQAAGGAGGSSDGATNSSGAGSGGCSGGWVYKTVANPAGEYAYSIGAAGAKGAAGNNAGGTGSDTTLTAPGLSITAKGGQGGAGSGAAAATDRSLAGTAPQAGTTGGDINDLGASGEGGCSWLATATRGGKGGDSRFGGGGRGTSNEAGVNGNGYGSGGSGASSVGNTDRQGGDGAAGLIMIWEFA